MNGRPTGSSESMVGTTESMAGTSDSMIGPSESTVETYESMVGPSESMTETSESMIADRGPSESMVIGRPSELLIAW